MTPADWDLEPWSYAPPKPFPLNTEIVGTGRTFGDFLAWANSEVLDSQRRGFVAEFMVAQALGMEDAYISGDMYDLRYKGGIQVKASSARCLPTACTSRSQPRSPRSTRRAGTAT